MTALLQEQQEKHWGKNVVAVITQDMMKDVNLKRQIKNRAWNTYRLFLPT